MLQVCMGDDYKDCKQDFRLRDLDPTRVMFPDSKLSDTKCSNAHNIPPF